MRFALSGEANKTPRVNMEDRNCGVLFLRDEYLFL